MWFIFAIIFLLEISFSRYLKTSRCKYVNGIPLRNPIPRVKYIVVSHSTSSHSRSCRVFEKEKKKMEVKGIRKHVTRQ